MRRISDTSIVIILYTWYKQYLNIHYILIYYMCGNDSPIIIILYTR